MKSILLCFSGIDNINYIKTIIMDKTNNIQRNNNYFPLLFFNIFDIIEMKKNGKINNIEDNNNNLAFLNILNLKASQINDIPNDIRPVIFLRQIIKLNKQLSSLHL